MLNCTRCSGNFKSGGKPQFVSWERFLGLKFEEERLKEEGESGTFPLILNN